jgi:dihydropteroate synthase
MHTGRDRDKHDDVIADQFLFLERSLEIAGAAGVARDCIVLDPGFGFAKDTEENLELMARTDDLHRRAFRCWPAPRANASLAP